MRNRIWILVLGVAALLGCGMAKGREHADREVARFHEQLNAAKLDEIWDSAAPELREATKRESFEALLGAIRRKLGNVTGSRNQNWNVASFNLRTRVVLVQDTTFETGRAVETFTYFVSGDAAKLAGYNVNSMDLITR